MFDNGSYLRRRRRFKKTDKLDNNLSPIPQSTSASGAADSKVTGHCGQTDRVHVSSTSSSTANKPEVSGYVTTGGVPAYIPMSTSTAYPGGDTLSDFYYRQARHAMIGTQYQDVTIGYGDRLGSGPVPMHGSLAGHVGLQPGIQSACALNSVPYALPFSSNSSTCYSASSGSCYPVQSTVTSSTGSGVGANRAIDVNSATPTSVGSDTPSPSTHVMRHAPQPDVIPTPASSAHMRSSMVWQNSHQDNNGWPEYSSY